MSSPESGDAPEIKNPSPESENPAQSGSSSGSSQSSGTPKQPRTCRRKPKPKKRTPLPRTEEGATSKPPIPATTPAIYLKLEVNWDMPTTLDIPKPLTVEKQEDPEELDIKETNSVKKLHVYHHFLD